MPWYMAPCWRTISSLEPGTCRADASAAESRGQLRMENGGTVSRINADFDQRVALPPPGPGDWVDSPMAGVARRMLDRVGGEVARATSLVR